ncbi:hypothetical protein KUTeg_001218 [Tegillarca granosa]|uniref:KY-like immunoglobulin-like domain-containing protein n=1 Tax=Tegillarca granosa TaxID=220873 RepID=A0ABQ9FVH7_TEGGR|nr:hypothetical protein KUTeg_001218 [Tegillarca granosa]
MDLIGPLKCRYVEVKEKTTLDIIEHAADLKDRLRKLGFYRDPPTPELLREAKHVYETLDWPRLLDPEGNPLPCPPKTSKYEVLDDDDRLEELDEYAIQVPTSYINAPVQDLVEHLIQPTSSDVEKARVLTRWLGRCLEEDYQRYIPRSGTITTGTTASYLRRLKQREIDYDELFQVLCRYTGIKSQAISGCVRNTVKYEVGDDFRGQRKTWTAALLDGDWRLLDVRWICEAAYGVAKKKWRLIEDDKGKVIREKHLKNILDHSKLKQDEEKWQLLARPLTYEEARDSAALRADFFRLGMSVKTNPTCVCENDEGQTTFVFGLEDDESVSFVYKLYQDKDCKSNVVSGREKLERYVFLERDMDEKVVRVVIRYPSEGKYLFELHGSETQETHHSILCTYMIFCTGIMEDCKPLPPNIRKEWGPSTDTKEMGLTPLTHRKGQIEAEDGDAQIRFGLSKDLEFRHDLIHGEKEVPLSERHVIHTVEDGKVNINLRLPKSGEYALNVMAKEKNKGVAFAPACTYLVSCEDEPLQSTPFPDIVDGANLGPTEDFGKLGFSEDDPWPSYITNLVTGELNMEIKRPPSMQVYATLVYEGEKSENFNNYVICDKDKERVFINTTFPKHGTYKLSLYARPPNGGHPDKDILIYVKVIEVMLPTLSGMPGPIQFMSDWCNDCYIKEPRKCYLPSDERQKIALSLPDAKDITIKDHPECRMRKTKDALWEGFVKTGPSGSVLEVMATPKSEEKPAKILTYQVFNLLLISFYIEHNYLYW